VVLPKEQVGEELAAGAVEVEASIESSVLLYGRSSVLSSVRRLIPAIDFCSLSLL